MYLLVVSTFQSHCTPSHLKKSNFFERCFLFFFIFYFERISVLDWLWRLKFEMWRIVAKGQTWAVFELKVKNNFLTDSCTQSFKKQIHMNDFEKFFKQNLYLKNWLFLFYIRIKVVRNHKNNTYIWNLAAFNLYLHKNPHPLPSPIMVEW